MLCLFVIHSFIGIGNKWKNLKWRIREWEPFSDICCVNGSLGWICDSPKLRALTHTIARSVNQPLSPSPSDCVKAKKHDGVLLQSTARIWRLHHLHGSWQIRERGAYQIRFRRRHLVIHPYLRVLSGSRQLCLQNPLAPWIPNLIGFGIAVSFLGEKNWCLLLSNCYYRIYCSIFWFSRRFLYKFTTRKKVSLCLFVFRYGDQLFAYYVPAALFCF